MSDILEMVHQSALGAYKTGVMDKKTMKEFDELCLPKVEEFNAEKIKNLRIKLGVSQPVLAHYINVSDKAVKKWEQGIAKPSGAALRLLSLIDKKGLQVIY